MFVFYVAALLSVGVYFYGLFPVPSHLENIKNEPPSHIENIFIDKDIYKSEISKTVIIVIDAIRLDFIKKEYMPLTTSLTNTIGCFNRITVEAPTVTLPRIKSLTAGNVPQFIDLIYNLVNTDLIKDSLIHSIYNRKKKMVFYGDDVWLKLFPTYFSRFEGVSSFFVNDFVEVDNNVTRNVVKEIKRQDWDVMILHYLGLDHIGHVYGPFSSLIHAKLQEMDEIIYKIYENVKENRTLLVITGDHGMKDSGGHGGSSYMETNVPLLFIGIHCQNNSFPQTDISTNLAVLLGVDIPSTAIGQVQKSLISSSLEKYLYLQHYNVLLLKQKTNICNKDFELATKFHRLYIENFQEFYGFKAAKLYENCSNLISTNLLGAAHKQEIYFLVFSMLLMFGVLSSLTIKTLMNISRHKNCYKSIYKNIEVRYFIVLNIIQPITFFSTSFIEEEHQFWYSIIAFLFLRCIILFCRSYQLLRVFCYIILLILLRFLRSINSTGVKWASNPDFSDWLLKNENVMFYQIFTISGFLLILISHYLVLNKINFIQNFYNILTFSLIYIFKYTGFVSLGRLIWLLIILHFFLFHKTSKITTWILISALLLKPFNIILIPCCILFNSIYSKYFSDFSIVFTHMWLGNMLYFAQGHSNSLANIDISVGYIGLTEYNPLLVIIQILCHSYTFPVLCHLMLFDSISRSIFRETIWNILFVHRLYVTFVVCFIMLVFKNHLFIWSVFAPKLFIECVHLSFLFIEYCLYIFYTKYYSYISSYISLQHYCFSN